MQSLHIYLLRPAAIHIILPLSDCHVCMSMPRRLRRPEPSVFGKAEPKRGGGKGMQLGKAKKGANDFLDSLRAEGPYLDSDGSGILVIKMVTG